MQTKEFREPCHEEISRAAFYHWQAAGSPEGQADQHWFAAETHLMRRQAVKDGTNWARVNEDTLPT